MQGRKTEGKSRERVGRFMEGREEKLWSGGQTCEDEEEWEGNSRGGRKELKKRVLFSL